MNIPVPHLPPIVSTLIGLFRRPGERSSAQKSETTLSPSRKGGGLSLDSILYRSGQVPEDN
jgi:hypothetical protein